MISLKGFRNINVDGINYKYKCKSHEKTIVHIEGNKIFYIFANNSGEVNQMSLPSIVAQKIREYINKN